MESVRQFGLLLKKNLILSWRHKIWTLLEFVLPIVVTIPTIVLMGNNRYADSTDGGFYPGYPRNFYGNVQDYISTSMYCSPRPNTTAIISFSVASGADEAFAKEIMELLAKKYTPEDSIYNTQYKNIQLTKFNSETDMLNAIQGDVNRQSEGYYCLENGFYFFGINFNELDKKNNVLSYTVVLGIERYISVSDYHLGLKWQNPYKISKYQASYTALTSIQIAMDNSFISLASNNKFQHQNATTLEQFPDIYYQTDLLLNFLYFLPVFWGLCSFLAVVHGARELTHEKATVRDFLSVMGLGTGVFYLSHIFYSWIKCVIIFFACAIPLCIFLPSLSWTLFFFTLILYALGSVVFGTMIAALFLSPNTTLKAIILCWAILIGLVYVSTPTLENMTGCFLVSLNLNSAFFYAAHSIEMNLRSGHDMTWSNMFDYSSLKFTYGLALVMIIVDIIWMLILTFIFDYVRGNVDFSIRRLFCCCKDVKEYKPAKYLSDSYEEEGGANDSEADMEVNDLVKIYSETGERAVDGISFKAYKGQVMALLGHNGAGKSTTFAALCGMTKPTSGEIRICQKNVGSVKTRRDIGLCPQINPLFDRLTVDEHLWLVHGLKRAPGSHKDEAKRLLDIMGLYDKNDECSMNLSGGMKRKLCVAMALIGESPVILLDEPTAGMDPGARRDVEKLIQEEKKTRTFFLTTHYMDEAETLGDRIAIMSRGQIVASGSSQFLKKRFGTGYILTIVVNDDRSAPEVAETILASACRFVSNTTIGDVHAQQIELFMPKEEQKNFAELFEFLESNKKELAINSFGLSVNTLEQVFIKVCELAEPTSPEDAEKIRKLNEELILSQKDKRRTGPRLWIGQTYSILLKRVLYSIRNWPQLFAQVLFPLVIFACVTILSQTTGNATNSGSMTYSLSTLGPVQVMVQNRDNSKLAKHCNDVISRYKKASMFDLPLSINSSSYGFLPYMNEYPPVGIGITFQLNESYNTYSSIYDKISYNPHAWHSQPIGINFYSNVKLQAAVTGGQITTSIVLFGAINNDDDTYHVFSSNFIDDALGPLIVIAMALVTSTFIMFLVEERRLKFTHQQSLTGISPICFWLSTILYDLLFYAIMCCAFLIYFEASDWLTSFIGSIIVLWILYFFACMPFIYSTSYLFTSPTKANVVLVAYQLVAPLGALAIQVIVEAIAAAKHKASTLHSQYNNIFLLLIPSYGLGYGLFTEATLKVFYPKTWQYIDIWKWDYLGRDVFFMTLFGAVLWTVFLLFQFKFVRHTWYRLWNRIFNRIPKNEEPIPDDPDVARERQAIEQLSGSSKLALEVKGLTKYFGKFRAVDNLTMGIRNGECFGLLGVNGSGKTTTFDILTGQSFSTRGTAKIDNRNVTNHLAVGYCPQFDALLLDLTGRETLTILARQYGFLSPSRKAKLVLNAVGLSEQADKLVRHYSGGQKRKLSVGLALLATTRIIILDEPTAGIDPRARRDIWEVLTAVRDYSESAILLTSHSMEECEALCSRIAILKKGHMVAIGTSQYLKSKYGNTYTLTMTTENIEQRDLVIEIIKRDLPEATLKTADYTQTLTLKWQIPKTPNDRWSKMFSRCQKISTESGAKDFCLAQSTLEETFLIISHGENEMKPPEGKRPSLKAQNSRIYPESQISRSEAWLDEVDT